MLPNLTVIVKSIPVNSSIGNPMRTAKVMVPDHVYGEFVTILKRYMPSNYRVYVCDDDILIAGNDVAGWTLDGYVIPRLASGGYTAKEI
jgi:hypothetical protein